LIAGLVHPYLGYQIDPDALAAFALENLFNQQYSRYLDVAPSPGHGLAPLPFLSARQLASSLVCAKLGYTMPVARSLGLSRGKRQE
jgi:hypothetical protein